MMQESEREFLMAQRVGRLATADARGNPHVVPVCFAIVRRHALRHDRREAEARRRAGR